MKKTDFVILVLAVLGTLVFGTGMSLCLVERWNAMQAGLIVAGVGGVLLLAAALLVWRLHGKPVKPDWKLIGKGVYCVFAALVFGVGMCLFLVWEQILAGALVGVLGVGLLLGIIPLVKGLH